MNHKHRVLFESLSAPPYLEIQQGHSFSDVEIVHRPVLSERSVSLERGRISTRRFAGDTASLYCEQSGGMEGQNEGSREMYNKFEQKVHLLHKWARSLLIKTCSIDRERTLGRGE